MDATSGRSHRKPTSTRTLYAPRKRDPDVWIVEIESSDGSRFLTEGRRLTADFYSSSVPLHGEVALGGLFAEWASAARKTSLFFSTVNENLPPFLYADLRPFRHRARSKHAHYLSQEGAR